MRGFVSEMTCKSLKSRASRTHSRRMPHKGRMWHLNVALNSGRNHKMSLKPSAVESTPARENRVKQLEISPAQGGAQAFRNATRIQASLTSARDRRVLLWLAARMPCWVTSDQLTLLGFAAMLLAGASYLLARWHPVGLLLATVCLALNWFGDSLDGTLARVRNMQRPRYGFYVDHMVDSFGALFLM